MQNYMQDAWGQQLTAIEREPASDPITQIKRYIDLCAANRLTHPQPVFELLLRIQTLLTQTPSLVEQVRCQTLLTELHMRKGNYQQALQIGTPTLTLALEQCLDSLQLPLYSIVGTVNWLLGDSTNAIRLFQQEHQLAVYKADHFHQAGSLSNISLVYTTLEQYQMAANKLQNALTLYKQKDNYFGQAVVLNNLAYNYCTGGYDTSVALQNALHSLAILEELNTPLVKLYVYDNLAHIYLQRKDYGLGRYYSQVMYEMGQALDIPDQCAIGALRLGQLAVAEQHEEQGLNYLLEAMQRFQALDNQKEQMQCHQLLASIYDRQQAPEKALHHYKAYQQLRETRANVQVGFTAGHLLAEEDLRRLTTALAQQQQELSKVMVARDQAEAKLFLVICANCKKIRNVENQWLDAIAYLLEANNVSHGICPECMATLYPNYKRKR